MTSTALHMASAPGTAVDVLRRWMVTMVFVSSFVSIFQPAPCDYFFVLAVLFSLGSGLQLGLPLMPLLLILLLYNVSCLISWIVLPVDEFGGDQFLLGLAYTSFSAVFFAAYIALDPERRYWQIVKAYWVGATIGSALGLLKYFGVEPIDSLLSGYNGRVVGVYKDPNVFSTWLVPALITLMQAIILGRVRLGFMSIISLSLIVPALFLAFSRGAWLNCMIAAVVTVGLTYALSPSQKLRGRIIVSFSVGVALVAIMLAILLSIPETRDVFLDRFTLTKSYDAGEQGRFGNQLNAIPMLMERPLGFGPYQFEKYFGLSPHNTFLNSFAAGGWLGGISFICFVIATFVAGFRAVFTRSPFQPYAIVAFACFISVTVQGVQIDMEHWRHMYWMVGLVWGFFAASFSYQHRPPTLAAYFEGWNLPLPDQLNLQKR
jgi:hypothetical protein